MSEGTRRSKGLSVAEMREVVCRLLDAQASAANAKSRALLTMVGDAAFDAWMADHYRCADALAMVHAMIDARLRDTTVQLPLPDGGARHG